MTTSSSFDSPGESPGTAFAATTAATLAAPPVTGRAATTGASRSVASDWNPRVLVVDDDDICRIAAQRLLEQLGSAVDVARDGQEALNLSAGWPYVAIFMDCAMPNVDGYQAARKIRFQDRDGTGALVIAVTTHSRQICLAAGMDHHIPKPIRLDLLAAECTKLGLLPRTDGQASPPAAVPASETPLLMAPPGMSERRSAVSTATRAETFFALALVQWPALWRAANARDVGSLGRIALQLKSGSKRRLGRVADLLTRWSPPPTMAKPTWRRVLSRASVRRWPKPQTRSNPGSRTRSPATHPRARPRTEMPRERRQVSIRRCESPWQMMIRWPGASSAG